MKKHLLVILLALAAKVGTTRLIDNALITCGGPVA